MSVVTVLAKETTHIKKIWVLGTGVGSSKSTCSRKNHIYVTWAKWDKNRKHGGNGKHGEKWENGKNVNAHL